MERGAIMELNIRPSADLRNKYNEISKQCRETREAVIITVNGRGDTAVLGLQDYKQMKAELELLRTLAEAEDDVKNGRDFGVAFDDVVSEYDDCDYYHMGDIYDDVEKEIERIKLNQIDKKVIEQIQNDLRLIKEHLQKHDTQIEDSKC